MIFNGIEKGYIKVNMELFRPPTPPIAFYTTERQRGGSRTRKKRFTDMVLPVPVTIKSDRHIEFLKEEISNWLYHEGPKQLIFKQIPNRYYLAEYESMELDERYKYAKGVINFYLAEGYRFGEDKKINLTTTNQTFLITGQIETPWTSRTVFTESASQFTIVGPYGGNITLNYNFIEGDVLEIDYKTRDVYLNGNDLAVAVDLRTEWFELPTGNVTLRASHPTEVAYTERYY